MDPAEKEALMNQLLPELAVLRAKAGISQDNLAGLVGVSRQTYNAVERGFRKMSWGMYLSLVFFYDNIADTHDYIRKLGVFPEELVKHFNQSSNLQ